MGYKNIEGYSDGPLSNLLVKEDRVYKKKRLKKTSDHDFKRLYATIKKGIQNSSYVLAEPIVLLDPETGRKRRIY